jgi:hypothetical protein
MTSDNTDKPLPFTVTDFALIEDEILDCGIERGDELFAEFTEIIEDVQPLDAATAKLHFFHRLARELIDMGVESEGLVKAVRREKREAVKARKIARYAARLG